MVNDPSRSIAVPFYVCATKIFFQCKHLYSDKNKQNMTIYYCAQKDNLKLHRETGQQLTKCEGCSECKIRFDKKQKTNERS